MSPEYYFTECPKLPVYQKMMNKFQINFQNVNLILFSQHGINSLGMQNAFSFLKSLFPVILSLHMCLSTVRLVLCNIFILVKGLFCKLLLTFLSGVSALLVLYVFSMHCTFMRIVCNCHYNLKQQKLDIIDFWKNNPANLM